MLNDTALHPKNIAITSYSYELPDDKIAKYPLPNRDESKLLIYTPDGIAEDAYKNIAAHLPKDSAIIFNETKVVNARLFFKKATGAKIEIFCLEPDERYHDVQTAMLQQREVYWKCLIGGASKWKDGSYITLIEPIASLNVSAAIHQVVDGAYIIHIKWDGETTFSEVLSASGQLPIPPYLNRKTEESDLKSYQTIFANHEGSVAAPTAALHFTPHILEQLQTAHIKPLRVTLHVGAGTFKPVKAATMEAHDMHPEFIEVDKSLIQALLELKNNHKKIIAVGTTSVRTLESLYWIGYQLTQGKAPDLEHIAVNQWLPYEQEEYISLNASFSAIISYMEHNNMDRLVTRTQIIIAPGYDFKIVDNIITNFHQPQSTLLLLVSAFIGEDWRKVYDYALEHNFRFLSYGDGSLLYPNRKVNLTL